MVGVTGDATAGRDQPIRDLAEKFPGWEAWQSLDSQWHARIAGATPPVMVHASSLSELCRQIRRRTA
jgi:hypothetical protein